MKRPLLLSSLILGALLLSACGTPSNASWPGLAADSQNAYVTSGQFVYALRLSDGAKLWQYPEKAGSQTYYSNPVIAPNGQVLVGSAGIITDSDSETAARSLSELNSLDPATGRANWLIPFTASDHWVASPLVVDNTVYAANRNGTLYAIDLAKGEKIWSLTLGNSLWGSPVTNGTLIFVTSLDHYLYAVDPETRSLAWKFDLGGSSPGAASVSSDGSTVFAGSFAKKVFGVDAATGKPRWTADLKDWVWGSPVLLGDSVFAADIAGNVYSLGSPNGKNAWPALQPDGPITATPVLLDNGVLIATESGMAFAYDPTGVELWKTTVGGAIYTTPVVTADLILIAPMNADFMLAALKRDGSLLWKSAGR